MSVGFMGRLRTLFMADAHAVLESLEERSLLLKQHLREAEIELGRKRARVEALSEQGRQLNERCERLRALAAEVDRDVELALNSGDETLARFSVRKLLPLRKELEAAESQLAQRGRELSELEQRLADQEERFSALKRRVHVELAQERAPEAEAMHAVSPAVAEEEVDLELLRRRAAPQREDA